MFRRACRLLTVVLLAFVGISVARFGAAPFPQDDVIPGTMSRVIFAGYDAFGSDWQTTLLLNNTTRVPLVVNPAAYSLDGTSATLPPIPLAAREHKRVDFGQLVAPLGTNFARGSLQLQFIGPFMGLGAILSSVNPQQSLVVEAVLHTRAEFKSTRLEAIWSAPDTNARITVTLVNTTESALSASVVLSAQDGTQIKSQPVPLASRQTRMLNLRELMAWDDLLGGISINYDLQFPGAVFAQGYVLKPETGFSYNIPFVDPSTLGQSKFTGAGILLGPTDSAMQPTRNMSGLLLLRNISVIPITVMPILQQGDSKTALPTLTLQQGQSRQVNVSADSAPSGNGPIGIEVPFSGSPGQLLAQWFSVDDSGNLVVEAPLRSPAPGERASGNNPFLLTGDYTSVTYIKNTGDKAAAVLMYIQHPGGQYMIGLKPVNPGDTISVDIRKLRDEQVKDENGAVLPLDLSTGQMIWRWHHGAPIVGRTSVMSPSLGIASNRSCVGGCNCGPASVSYALQSMTLAAGDTSPAILVETQQDCFGNVTFQEIIANSGFTWTTSDHSVAVVDNATGIVTAIGPGASGLQVSGTPETAYYWCSCGFLDGGGECDPDPNQNPTFSAPATLTVHDFVISGAQTIKDGQQGTFSVTVTGGTATAYQWSFSAPSGAGNSPNVNFTTPASSQTNTDGHWFAKPNVACPSQTDLPSYYDAVYTIKAKVTFSDGKDATRSAKLTVNAYWNPAGFVDPSIADVTGGPHIDVDANGTWHVLDKGTLARQVPTSATINVISTSQFYTKTVQHEQVHVNQWIAGTGHLWGDLYNPDELFNQFKNLTGTSQSDLFNKLVQAKTTYINGQGALYQQRITQAEREAHVVSDPIPPQYVYQNCGQY
jgi:hypothetical protein